MTAAMSSAHHWHRGTARLERVVRHPVAAKVERDEAELASEIAADLMAPAHVVAGPPVDQEHGRERPGRPTPEHARVSPAPPPRCGSCQRCAVVVRCVMANAPFRARSPSAAGDQRGRPPDRCLSAAWPVAYAGLCSSGFSDRSRCAVTTASSRSAAACSDDSSRSCWCTRGPWCPADRLVDVLWAGQPPADARQALWTCVARLRRALADQAGPPADELLVTRPPGYVWSARARADRRRSVRAPGLGRLADRGHPARRRGGPARPGSRPVARARAAGVRR